MGADGDLPCMHNWQNDEHVRRLAALWNVDELQIPHWGPPTHVMQMMRYIEEGSIALRNSSRLIGPTRIWFAASNLASSG